MLQSKRVIAGTLCAIVIALHITAVARISGVPLLAAPYQGGWTPNQEQHKVSWEAQEWAGAGEGQTRLLYKDYEQVHGYSYAPKDQGSSPSCVGYAAATAIDFLAAVEIRSGEPERAPPANADPSVIYGLSRVEIGGLTPDSGPGAFNIWACWALKQYGAVAQLNYGLLGHDLRYPSLQRDYQFGEEGIPIGLEFIAKIHPIRDYIPINSYEECRDAIFMGYPIIVGSTQGFGDGQLRRDRDGFLNPPQNRWRPSIWNHSMCIMGVADTGRKGCLLINSWGANWISGPKRFEDEPEGTFWVDAKIIDSMVKQGDTFAFKSFKGYAQYQLWMPKK